MTTLRLEIESLIPTHSLDRWIEEANNDLGLKLSKLVKRRVYKIESDDSQLKTKMDEQGNDVFFDPIIEKVLKDHQEPSTLPQYVVEVGMKPGVTDNPARAAREALELLNIKAEVASGQLYFVYGEGLNKESVLHMAKDIMANDLIQSIDVCNYEEFKSLDRFKEVSLPHVVIQGSTVVTEINLEISDEELEKMSVDNCLALTLEEMKHLRDYYRNPEVKEKRKQMGLPINPTDVEVEVAAQTWSEHCKHKIFAADIDYKENYDQGKKLGDKNVEGLYKSFVKASTNKIKNDRNLSWLISVFSDNAGIVRFDEKVDVCIKAETHNSPSALDPYGGALTGILGVNRDILGCGLGARPIANTDVFCFAPPTMPQKDEVDLMPAGLKHPRRIFEGVHLGVEDGGNKSGIPTVNGAIYFDKDYAGKPLVFCGTVGVMPQKLKDGVDSSVKYPKPGDKIVMVGGEIGADGIHGATFSSLELNENSPSTAVQIGDPLTQKRALEFLIEARDKGLYTCITDNGAGGLSSSVGEMAELTGGAKIDLAKAPVKYPGLTPFELMISESQERMTVGVPAHMWDDFSDLAKKRNVDASDLGIFTDTGYLEVQYEQKPVAHLDLEWLHGSLPQMKLKANWTGPKIRKSWNNIDRRENIPNQVKATLTKLLSTPNIASKESWVRRYDHEVQASTHVKPFVGPEADGPGDSGVVWLAPHGGARENAVSIGCGLNPRVSQYDGYYMAQFAVDEAVRNVVVSGGDIDHLCLLDNFCWPDPVQTAKNPDGDYKLAQLVRTCEGLYDICLEYGTPLVSGKDSMKNDFRGKNRKGDPLTISILPTLLVTAMAKTDIRYTVTSEFKDAGDLIYVIGKKSYGLAGSELCELYKIEDNNLPNIDISANKLMYRTYNNALKEGLVQSGHDISDGGLLCAIAESCIGARMGAKIDIESDRHWDDLFNEGPGRFVVSVKPENQKRFEEIFKGIDCQYLGSTCEESNLELNLSGNKTVWSVQELVESFKKEL